MRIKGNRVGYFCVVWVSAFTTLLCPPLWAVTFGGFEWQPLGQAQISTTTDGLQVINVGSSGNDGARLLLPDGFGTPNSDFKLHAQLSGLGNASDYPVGAFIQATPWGTIDGSPGQVVDHITATTVSGGGLSIHVDMSPLAPESLRADYYLQGVNVLSEPNISPIATTYAHSWLPDDVEVTFTLIPPSPNIGLSWLLAESFARFGGGNITADALDFSAIGSVKTFGGYSAIDYTGSQIGGFVITSVPEPATITLLGLGGLAMMRKRRK
jgi:hypothetical protein